MTVPTHTAEQVELQARARGLAKASAERVAEIDRTEQSPMPKEMS